MMLEAAITLVDMEALTEGKKEMAKTEKISEEASKIKEAGVTKEETMGVSIKISETVMAEEEVTIEVASKKEETSREGLAAEVAIVKEEVSAKKEEASAIETTEISEETTETTEITETTNSTITVVETEETEIEETEVATEATDLEMTREASMIRPHKRTGNVLTAVTSTGLEDKSAINARSLVLRILNGSSLNASIVIVMIKVEVIEVETEEEETIETKETNALIRTSNKMIFEVKERIGAMDPNKIP